MDIRAAATQAVVGLLGRDAAIVRWPVDHRDRCVAEVRTADGGRVAIKVAAPADALARERAVLRAAHAAGLPVPEVLAYRAGSPAILLLEWLDGRWLSPERSERAWHHVGGVLRRLHRLDVADLGFYARTSDWSEAMSTWVAYQLPPASKLGLDDAAGRIADAVAGLLRDADPPLGTLHGDCAPIHVRLDHDDRVVGLLDFGDAIRGDVALDLAVLTLRSPDRLDSVLAGYDADVALTRWATRAAPVYRAFRHLGEAVWLANHDFDPAQAIAETSTAAARLEDPR